MTIKLKALLVLLVISMLAGTACRPGSVDPQSLKGTYPGKITIFHSNDLHGRIENLGKIAWLVAREKEKKTGPVLLFSAGDVFSGNPVVDRAPQKGRPMVELMNLAGYDLHVLGNHEFDYGIEALNDFMEQADFPVLAANLDSGSSGLNQPEPLKVFELEGGFRLFVLGLTQVNEKSGLPGTNPAKLTGLTFQHPLQTAQRFSGQARESDLFVILSHAGLSVDEILAREIPGLDLIIGGHSHTVIRKPQLLNGVAITQAGSYGRYLGRIDIELEAGKKTGISGRLIDLARVTNEDPLLAEKISRYNDNPVFKRRLAELKWPLTGPEGTGALVTDAMRLIHDLDLAFTNSGGLRRDFSAGPLLVRDVYELYPFDDQVVIFELKLREVEDLIRNAYRRGGTLGLQISGATYTVFVDQANRPRGISLLDESGRPLDKARLYRVGVNSYIAAGYDFARGDGGRAGGGQLADDVIAFIEGGADLEKYRSLVRARVERQ